MLLLRTMVGVPEIADMCGVSAPTVRRWLRAAEDRRDVGEMPAAPDYHEQCAKLAQLTMDRMMEICARTDFHEPQYLLQLGKFCHEVHKTAQAVVDSSGTKVVAEDRSELLERCKRISASAERLRLVS